MILASGSVLGIDGGCSSWRRSSAVCSLDWTASEVTWTLAHLRAAETERVETIRTVAGSAHLEGARFDVWTGAGAGVLSPIVSGNDARPVWGKS